MNKIKERCMWFIGANRMQGTKFKGFMYSETDIVLINHDGRFNITSTDKNQIIGMSYTLAKCGIKEV